MNPSGSDVAFASVKTPSRYLLWFIYIAGLGFGLELGLGLLYYAENSHWFFSRIENLFVVTYLMSEGPSV